MPAMTAAEALEAIIARIDGVWDHPALEKFGPLTPSCADDVKAIAREGLRACRQGPLLWIPETVEVDEVIDALDAAYIGVETWDPEADAAL